MAVSGIINIAQECLHDFLNIGHTYCGGNQEHIKHAADWIISAQQAGKKSGGVAAGYSILGWDESYPEVTGYIIPTLFELSSYFEKPRYKESALAMADWLVSIQLESGAFPGPRPKTPMVFDTGQILFGLVRAYEETKSPEYLSTATRAAEWLSSIQEDDGSWEKHVYKDGKRSYHARVAWALLEAYNITQKKEFLIAGKKNLDWVLTQQLDNGWFMNAAFESRRDPFLHTIAYVLEGLLEGGVWFNRLEYGKGQYLSGKNYINSVVKAADALITLQQENGSLFGIYDRNWTKTCGWSCLVGNAQTSVVWLRLYSLTGRAKYLEAAKKMNKYLKATQNIKSRDRGINGGIKGSQPIYGRYAPFGYISWGAKFFIDALLLEQKLSNEGGPLY